MDQSFPQRGGIDPTLSTKKIKKLNYQKNSKKN